MLLLDRDGRRLLNCEPYFYVHSFTLSIDLLLQIYFCWKYERRHRDGWGSQHWQWVDCGAQRKLGQEDGFSPLLDGLCCGSWKLMEISVSLYEKWRRWVVQYWFKIIIHYLLPCIIQSGPYKDLPLFYWQIRCQTCLPGYIWLPNAFQSYLRTEDGWPWLNFFVKSELALADLLNSYRSTGKHKWVVAIPLKLASSPWSGGANI